MILYEYMRTFLCNFIFFWKIKYLQVEKELADLSDPEFWDEDEDTMDSTLDESGVIRRGLSILDSTDGDTTMGSTMDSSADPTPAKPEKEAPVKVEEVCSVSYKYRSSIFIDVM